MISNGISAPRDAEKAAYTHSHPIDPSQLLDLNGIDPSGDVVSASALRRAAIALGLGGSPTRRPKLKPLLQAPKSSPRAPWPRNTPGVTTMSDSDAYVESLGSPPLGAKELIDSPRPKPDSDTCATIVSSHPASLPSTSRLPHRTTSRRHGQAPGRVHHALQQPHLYCMVNLSVHNYHGHQTIGARSATR